MKFRKYKIIWLLLTSKHFYKDLCNALSHFMLSTKPPELRVQWFVEDWEELITHPKKK